MNFVDFLDEHNVPYLTEGHHHCRAGWIQFDCPFCGKGSSRYHMGYSLDGGYVACWRCRGHSLAATVAELIGIPIDAARKLIRGLEDTHAKTERKERGTLILPKPLEPLSKNHLAYLESRDISAKDAALWKLQGLGAFARLKKPDGTRSNLAWRIFIPYLYDGEIVSWTTRTISRKETQRYIAAPAECEAVDHKELLFGEDFARHAVCAVEGELDAVHAGPGFVAVGGTAFRRAQVLRLSRYNVRGVWFDMEPDAQKRARELVDMLSVFPGETLNFTEMDSKDPGSASRREINAVKKELGI